MPANRLHLPSAQPLIPYSCPADERGRDVAEYDENGHYRGGPQLAQPRALVKMIAERRDTEPPDLQRAAAEQAIAAERTAYRQQLPIPELAASTRAERRHGLGRAGVARHSGPRALLAAMRMVA